MLFRSQINKTVYARLKGIDVKEVPKPVKSDEIFTFGDCYPKYYKFETQEFNQFIFDIYTDTATYEKNFAETRGKIDELVELNPMWEADEFATWGPPTEISK